MGQTLMKIAGMKINKNILIGFWAFLTVLFPSCEKLFMEEEAGDDPVTVFDEIWTFADRHYSFFEEKGVDWDAIYEEYHTKVRPDMGQVELFDLCAAMLYELRDGHVNLLSSFDRSRYWEWFLESPENFYYSIVQRHYMKDRQRYIGPLQFVRLEEDIYYVYYSSFANAISESNLNMLINTLNSAGGRPGLIFDVRNNGGGSPDNARDIAARFTGEQRFAGTNYIKNGPGHEDFIAEEVYINPHEGPRFDGDVVVLTNRRSYSATTYFAQYMKILPNVTLVGDTTGGGGGIPAFRDLPNGWMLRLSSSRFLDPDGNSIESGVKPHVSLDLSPESLREGRDDIIEKAIEILR